MIHNATHKNGSPVSTGDRVMAVWDSGLKQFGRIEKIGAPMRFADKKNALLRTYIIQCDDGKTRPAHAWLIKYVMPREMRHTRYRIARAA